MNSLRAQDSTIEYTNKEKQMKNGSFLTETENIFFYEYIKPQFDWSWKNWIETGKEDFLDISLFWMKQYF